MVLVILQAPIVGVRGSRTLEEFRGLRLRF